MMIFFPTPFVPRGMSNTITSTRKCFKCFGGLAYRRVLVSLFFLFFLFVFFSVSFRGGVRPFAAHGSIPFRVRRPVFAALLYCVLSYVQASAL